MSSQTGELLRLEKSADAMGASFSIVLYGQEEDAMEAAVQAAFEETWRIEALLSVYRSDSEWGKINRLAAQEKVGISAESYRLIADCLEYNRQSEGAFDIGVGPLLKAWGFYRGTGRRPDPAEVTAALALLGSRHIHLDDALRSVRFDRPGLEIHPGGIGKGYAVDRMADLLRQKGFTTALLCASGSSLYGIGHPPGELRGWPVDIRDAENPRKSVAEVFLKDASLSTSGIQEKMFRADGRIYSHILDPRTGYPAQGMLQLSVMAPRAAEGEAWTKACFINGSRWAEAHRPKEHRIFMLAKDGPSGGSWLG
jgi:FAD:protein FMN transferase